ncbi:MAG: hypothetical protein IKP71_10850 [Candidatus Riflebacteria bacterium]|nr:hypothetical protein [Candidatus Riflebacteria bacterium]
MLKELLEYINTLKRPELITDDLGNRYLFNENAKQYSRIPLNASTERSVCNIESFAKVVKNVCSKFTGLNTTVIFKANGAKFYTDESLGQDQNIWMFDREYTLLWDVVKDLVRTVNKFTHRELLEKLESVRNYIIDFESLYQKLSKLRASKRISFASSPIFVDGENSGGYEWEQKIDANGSTEKATCPSKINFKGKIVRGSDAVYEFSININPVIDEENGRILFRICMPTIDLVLDQVREDEYQDFLKLIGDIADKKVLVLRDY